MGQSDQRWGELGRTHSCHSSQATGRSLDFCYKGVGKPRRTFQLGNYQLSDTIPNEEDLEGTSGQSLK